MAEAKRSITSDNSSVSEKDINPFTAADFDAVEGRRLEFLSKDLGHDIDLLLVFDPPKDAGRIFIDFFPVAWKVVSFTATGTSSAVIVFTGRAAFIVPQMNSGNIVFSANAQACELGEQCTLKVNEKGVSFLTEAEVGTPGIMKCINDTEAPAKIGLGFYNAAGTKAEPIFVWKCIDRDSILSVYPTSKLKIYAVSDYKGSAMISDEIESNIVWERDLNDLSPSTEWNLSYDQEAGKTTIDQVWL